MTDTVPRRMTSKKIIYRPIEILHNLYGLVQKGIGEFDCIPGKPYTIRDHFPAAPVPSGKYSLHRLPGIHPPPVLAVSI